MDLDFGLKFSKPVDHDLISTDLRINKDRGGLVFVFTETDSMFFLTAHLRGYKRENIRMSISPDGTQIKIEGKYPIQETLYVGGNLLRNIKTVEFKKSFKIPDGVVLNDVNATFDDESILTITMPKAVHGIRGVGIEEVVEEFHDHGKAKTTLDDHVNIEPSLIANGDRVYDKIDDKQKEPESRTRSSIQENMSPPIEEPRVLDNKEEKIERAIHSHEELKGSSPNGQENRKPMKQSNMCNSSIVVGSALFASLIAVVIHFLRKKTAQKKKNC